MNISKCVRCGKVVKADKDTKYKIIEHFPYTRRGSRTLWLCTECQRALKTWLEESKDEQSERK